MVTICFPTLCQPLPQEERSLQYFAKKETWLRAAETMKNCSSSLSVISFTKMLFSCPLSQQGGIGQSSGLGGGVARTSGIGGGGIIRTSHTYTSSAQMPSCAAAEIQGKNCNTLQDFHSLLYSNAARTGSHKDLSQVAYRCYLKVLLWGYWEIHDGRAKRSGYKCFQELWLC